MLRRLGYVIIGLSGIWGLAACDLAPPSEFDTRIMGANENGASGQTSFEYLRPLPTSRTGAAVGTEKYEIPEEARPATGPSFATDLVVRMSLQEIIHRAVANNHDVRVAGYQPGIEGARTVEAQANFDPAFYSNLSYQYANTPTGGQLTDSFNGATFNQNPVFFQETSTGTGQWGFQQNLPSGGQAQIQQESVYNYTRPALVASDPFWSSDLSLQLTQPLLRNYGYAVNQSQIVIQQQTQRVALLEFRKAVEQNNSDIEQAYWQLVQAEQFVRIQEDLLGRMEDTYNILYVRMKSGVDVSNLQVSQSQTALERNRAILIEFKQNVRDLSDKIKGLMSDPEYPVLGNVLILPADQPCEEPMEFNIEDEVATALENRFELGETQLRIDAATVTIEVAKNNLLPKLDFIGSIGPAGGGSFGVPNPIPGGSELASSSSIQESLREEFDFQHLNASAGIKLNIPIGNRAARAIWKRSMLQRLQLIEQYRGLVEQVAVDVKTAARAVSASWDIIVQARRSRYAAEDTLKAIMDRIHANEPLRPEFVQLELDSQTNLAQAQRDEYGAIANYNIAIAQLEKAKGTLLRYNNVLLEEDLPNLEENGLLH